MTSAVKPISGFMLTVFPSIPLKEWIVLLIAAGSSEVASYRLSSRTQFHCAYSRSSFFSAASAFKVRFVMPFA